MTRLCRTDETITRRGSSHTRHYHDVRAGLFPPPVKTGRRSVAWPSDEIDALNAARTAGASDDEIRALVRQLVEARKAKAAAAIAMATAAQPAA